VVDREMLARRNRRRRWSEGTSGQNPSGSDVGTAHALSMLAGPGPEHVLRRVVTVSGPGVRRADAALGLARGSRGRGRPCEIRDESDLQVPVPADGVSVRVAADS